MRYATVYAQVPYTRRLGTRNEPAAQEPRGPCHLDSAMSGELEKAEAVSVESGPGVAWFQMVRTFGPVTSLELVLLPRAVNKQALSGATSNENPTSNASFAY